MKKIQWAAACSFILPHLLQDSRSYVQLMFPECNVSCKRGLALDKARSTTFTAQRQSHYQTGLQCYARWCGYWQIKQAVGATWAWLPRCNPERKGFAGLDTLKDSKAQLRQFVTCRYKESVGQGSPRWHWGHLKRETVVNGNSKRWTLCDKDVWKSNVRSAMGASQLRGEERTDVDDAPAPARNI